MVRAETRKGRRMKRAISVAVMLGLAAAPAHAQGPAPIRSNADMPPARYPIAGPASTAFLGDAFARTVLPQLRHDAERLLATRRIDDPAIARDLRLGLAAIALLQKRPADARRLVLEQRAAETKPQLRAIGFMLQEAEAAAMAGDGSCEGAAAGLRRLLAGAEPAVVRDEVLIRYARMQVAGPGYYASGAATYDAVASAQKSVSLREGLTLAVFRADAQLLPPCRTSWSGVLKTWLDDPAHRAVDIWPARQPAAAALTGARQVVVADWESGFDQTLFPGQLALDPAEPLDGRDNDGNGVIDDVHGPTFDPQLRPTAQTIAPLSPFLADRLGLQMAVEKGERDLNAGADTADARFFAARSRDASAADQAEDVRASEEFGFRSHPTWVASVLADGAPFVRLYTLALSPYGAGPTPVPILEEDVDRWVHALPKAAGRLRGAGVRVVNISWIMTADEIASLLLDSGAERDPARAQARGAAMLARMKPALTAFIRDCPDTLFVAGAGNSGQSDEILAALPQTLDLPNILVVGAAASNGTAASFATTGGHVRLYASGVNVTVRSPGGMVMRSSGSSFAAPATARAAASMLAVAPRLSPRQLIDGIIATATRDSGIPLLHPAAALAWARMAQPGGSDGTGRPNAARPDRPSSAAYGSSSEASP
jgi:hypothetical protein